MSLFSLFGKKKAKSQTGILKPLPKPGKLERQQAVYDFEDEGIFESSDTPRRAMFSPSTKSTKSTASHTTVKGTSNRKGRASILPDFVDDKVVVPPTRLRAYNIDTDEDLTPSTKANTKKNNRESKENFRKYVSVQSPPGDYLDRSEQDSSKYVRPITPRKSRSGGKKSKKQTKSKKQRKTRRR